MATPSGVTLSTATATPEQLAHIGKLASELVSDGYRVGLGSGRAALSFVRELAARVAAEGPTITGVPTSIKTEELAQELGLPLATLDEIEEIATRLRFKTESGGDLLDLIERCEREPKLLSQLLGLDGGRHTGDCRALRRDPRGQLSDEAQRRAP